SCSPPLRIGLHVPLVRILPAERRIDLGLFSRSSAGVKRWFSGVASTCTKPVAWGGRGHEVSVMYVVKQAVVLVAVSIVLVMAGPWLRPTRPAPRSCGCPLWRVVHTRYTSRGLAVDASSIRAPFRSALGLRMVPIGGTCASPAEPLRSNRGWD